MLDFACDATYPRKALGPGVALRAAANPAISHCRTGAVVAHRVLLGGVATAAGRTGVHQQAGKAAYTAAGRDAGLRVRLCVVPRELLLDLPDHVFVRGSREACRRLNSGSLLPLPGVVPRFVCGSVYDGSTLAAGISRRAAVCPVRLGCCGTGARAH